MKRTLGTLAAVFCGVSSFAADVEIRLLPGERVNLQVKGAPLSDVLDRLSRQTGMKVVYDGAPPRTLVAASFEGTSPHAVVSVLEGLGVSYAMTLDRTSRRVDTLLVLGGAGGGGGAKGAPVAAPPPEPVSYQPAYPAAPEYEEPEEPIEEPMEEPEPAAEEPTPGANPGLVPGLPGAPPPPEDSDRKPEMTPSPFGGGPEPLKPFAPANPPVPVPDPTPPPGSE